jgi:hypothetical protein
MENHTRHMALSRDGKWLAIGTEGGWLSVWDVEKRKRLWRKKSDQRFLRFLSVSPDAKWLAFAGEVSTSVAFWGGQDGRARMAVDLKSHAATFLPDGEMLVSRFNRAGFARWDPVANTFRGGANWGEDRAVCRGTEYDEIRAVQRPEYLAVSRNGKAVALITGTSTSFRVTVFDLTKVRWQKR